MSGWAGVFGGHLGAAVAELYWAADFVIVITLTYALFRQILLKNVFNTQ